MPSMPLAALLDRVVRALWPRRTEQELLLDLGERKGWGDHDRQTALGRAANWLGHELLLADPVAAGPPAPASESALETLRAVGSRCSGQDSHPGVARWIGALAPATGASPKTLANSLSSGLRPERRDHRWLTVIARIEQGEGAQALDAWLFHRRTPSAVSRALSGILSRDAYDAADALVLLSLLALWQRRRPTERVRANKGTARSRRQTPKPVAALAGSLASVGQFGHLVDLAKDLRRPDLLTALAIEAALTEAHLGPHPARRSRGTLQDCGEAWLEAVLGKLDEVDCLDAEDVEAFKFRIERMRAWRERRPMAAGFGAPGVPYIEASVALEEARTGMPVRRAFSAEAPGLLMLLPLLRSRGLGGES